MFLTKLSAFSSFPVAILVKATTLMLVTSGSGWNESSLGSPNSDQPQNLNEEEAEFSVPALH